VFSGILPINVAFTASSHALSGQQDQSLIDGYCPNRMWAAKQKSI
jgi:hypothetical protein